jgi:hypothetical protein
MSSISHSSKLDADVTPLEAGEKPSVADEILLVADEMPLVADKTPFDAVLACASTCRVGCDPADMQTSLSRQSFKCAGGGVPST